MGDEDPEPLTPQMREMIARSLGRSSGAEQPPASRDPAVLREWRRSRPQWEQDLDRIRLWVTVIGWCVLAATIVSGVALWLAYASSQSSGY